MGDISISGSKNAVLGVLAASMMIDGKCTLENVPDISDVHVMIDLCRSLGATITSEVSEEGSLTLEIDPRGINTYKATGPSVSKIRASQHFWRLSRSGRLVIWIPPFSMSVRTAIDADLGTGK